MENVCSCGRLRLGNFGIGFFFMAVNYLWIHFFFIIPNESAIFGKKLGGKRKIKVLREEIDRKINGKNMEQGYFGDKLEARSLHEKHRALGNHEVGVFVNCSFLKV